LQVYVIYKRREEVRALSTRRPHKPSAKQQSQNRYDSEKRKKEKEKEKEKEKKANRTGTERSKKAKVLATTSQLDNTVFVFRNS
jgi:hypothetical protein